MTAGWLSGLRKRALQADQCLLVRRPGFGRDLQLRTAILFAHSHDVPNGVLEGVTELSLKGPDAHADNDRGNSTALSTRDRPIAWCRVDATDLKMS